jgi:ArsR family transcriptional regulator, arsenate/arsenite/antimonite-responsive transcriptional repressor
MPVTKTDLFKKADVRLAEIAKALAHPARIAILRELARRNECVCGEIVHVIPLAQSTVSQHLKELKEIGMIKGEVDGPRSCYCINPERMLEFAVLIGEFMGDISCTCAGKEC